MTKIQRPKLNPCPFCKKAPYWNPDTNKVKCSKGHTAWLEVNTWNACCTEEEQLRNQGANAKEVQPCS